MRAAVFHGKNDIRVEEVKQPVPGPGEVVIKVKACGVCGTDMHIYEGAEGAATCNPPTILGHEFSGVVSETGPDVTDLKVGDRVCIDPNDTCGRCYYCKIGKAHFCENMVGIGTTTDGGFAEYCVVREKQAYRFGSHLSFEEAAMAEPVACCLHGMDLTQVKPGQTVMIIGGGTIGLIMLQLAKLSGASTLIVLEPVASKRELAKKLGADVAVDPLSQDVKEVLNSYSIKSVDATIECVGLKSTMEDAIRYVSKGGTAMLFGLTNPSCEIPLKPFDVFRREITIKSSFINPYTQARAVSLIESGKINVNELITDRLNLKDITKVFGQDFKTSGKIVINP